MVNKFNNNFIDHVSEEEREAIKKLDSIDNTIRGVLADLNEHFEIGVKFDEIERSELMVEAREALLDALRIFR